MYERMLDKLHVPTAEEMAAYCRDNSALFCRLNNWLTTAFETQQKIVFPYGNSYGWGVAHRKKKRLICNVFAENNAFTVMVRLSGSACAEIYDRLDEYSKERLDKKYPCGDGGWVYYRVTCPTHFEEIRKILTQKCAR